MLSNYNAVKTDGSERTNVFFNLPINHLNVAVVYHIMANTKSEQKGDESSNQAYNGLKYISTFLTPEVPLPSDCHVGTLTKHCDIHQSISAHS